MHEMSLFKDLIGKIASISKENENKKIVRLTVKLGALSNLSPEHFMEHFDLFSVGTAAEGAELAIILSDDESDKEAQEVVLQDVEIEV